jgi:hypothetical protein
MKKRKDIYPPEKWSQSFTYNRWTVLTCSDILRLIPYEQACKNMPFFPTGNSANGLSTFFFLNHPINFVVVTARCTGFMKKTDSFWLTEVEDGTGSDLKVALFKVVPDKLMDQFTDKVIEIKGYIKETKMYGRQVNALDIRIVGEGNVADLALAPVDALEVRGHVLGVAWSFDNNAKKAALRSAMPMEYCSLMKVPSSLQEHKLFASKLKELESFNAKRTVVNDQSLLEKLGIAVPWAVGDSNRPADATSAEGVLGSFESNISQDRMASICLPGLDLDTMEELDRMYDQQCRAAVITFDKERGRLLTIELKEKGLDKKLEEDTNFQQQVDNGPFLTVSSEPSLAELLEEVQREEPLFIQFNAEDGTLVNIRWGSDPK